MGGRPVLFSLGKVSWSRQHFGQGYKVEKEVFLSPRGKHILGNEDSISRGPKAEGSGVRGTQCQLPEGTLSALFWMEFPAPRRTFGTEETLRIYYCLQACLNE